MESQFKRRLSRMLRSSFRSCSSKDVTDVIETTVSPADDHHHHQLFELFSPRPHSFPSICKFKWPEISFQTDNTCIISKKSFPFHRPSFSDKEALLTPPAFCEGQKCPPVSPISPFLNSQNAQTKNRVKKTRRRITNGVRRSRSRSIGMNDFPACSYNGLFSSDEEEEDDDDDRTTFFSSRSLSSESSQSARQGCRSSRALKDVVIEDGKKFEISSAMASPEGKKVQNSFAVMKRSNNPYNDFRTSMVEMIIEKNIFAAKDLENLLQCFLNLNSSRHHKVIMQVFNEIWEALFNNSS